MGKEAIYKYSAKYCIDRECFHDGAYILNVDHKYTSQSFQSQLLKTIGHSKHLKDLIKELSMKDILIIIVKCE